ncbi:DctP family TRAP transporter solute-binding subunit [Desulfovibrio subterraneus]|uniref:C4-dicarboxylate ABC transporter substrate-binding protein n=1 Tax=Desulfovibrio subterraneus TaxID=2718620 RepID=A0A7J0BFQ9_9BACT|nr:DctP family TRAP transporter solute-binding subunit [Desulfovibrio subterraneus]WBF68832.1 DctP family TRAP transporter solute-binding subunit [Desulfovibrio subterraneus]GFM32031.1 C4-dicarboxylate ABC transporter substrate-binding protein [Desulfovibrio subterraneus]
MFRFAKAVAVALLVVCLAVPAFAGKVVLKLGHIAEPVHPYGQGADYFAKLVSEKSGGEMEVRVFPSSQLGGQKDLIEGLIYGTVDMALVGTAVLGQFQPQISIFDLPFLFKDRDHAYKSLDTVGMELGKALESKGIKLLGYMENGIRHMTNNVRPIKTPEDMNGLKIRVMTNKIYVEMVKSLGASPTPMAFGELYSALQQGTVDGQENPSAHIFTKRFFEVQKYASLTAHAYAPEPMVISMVAWNRLTPAQQDILKAAAAESIVWQRDLSTREDAEYWDKIKATGQIEVIEVDRDKFAEATRPVYKEFADVVGQDNIDKIEALKN